MTAGVTRWHGQALRLLIVMVAAFAAACQATEPAKDARAMVDSDRNVAHEEVFREFSLTIYGYNYTDTEIGSFQVNGRGGGNLTVSTPTSAGGSSVCCMALFTPLPPHRTIQIRWTRDAVTWCVAEVPFNGPVPANAKYMEVHFYRDGRIELAATATNSPPRLSLQRDHPNSRHQDKSLNQIHDTTHARCQRGPH